MQTDRPPEQQDTWPTPEWSPADRRRTTLVDPAPPPPPAGPPPDRRIGWGMLLALGVLALVALGILIAWLVTHRDNQPNGATTVVVTSSTATGGGARPGAGRVAIPDVRGLDVAAAQAQLKAKGLDATTQQVRSSKPAGTVVAESPAPGGKVARGSGVALSVAAVSSATVPGLTGRSQSAAAHALQAAGLSAHTVTVPSSRPQGTVVAQHPAAGTRIPGGSSVRVNVSAGSQQDAQSSSSPPPAGTTTAAATTSTTQARPATGTVPDVSGDRVQSAVHQLDAAGFGVSIGYVPGDSTLGTIDAQSPAAGASATRGSHVTINASQGPGGNPEETVPDTTGQKLQQAVSTLNGAHLRLIFVKRTVSVRAEAGTVVEQTPAAGSHAPENAQVLVYLGAYRGG
ncbi:MAG TPA: PASTA domain-containing protein [Gaiellaceae bacterium]